MDLEASVIDRLQKLRQWQIEQQERLLQQQQAQREMLTQKQGCIYEALELSLQELNLNENGTVKSDIDDAEEVSENRLPPSRAISNSSFATTDNEDASAERVNIHDQDPCYLKGRNNHDISDIDDDVNTLVQCVIQKAPGIIVSDLSSCDDTEVTPRKQNANHSLRTLAEHPDKQINNFLMEGVTPLRMDKSINKHICMDDIPVPSPKKDFHVLLEEKLRNGDSAMETNNGTDFKAKAKKPFLKKGQGLSRYRVNHDTAGKPAIRSRSASLSASTRLNTKNSKTQDNKSGKATNTQNKTRKSISNTGLPPNQLSLKNIPLPKKKVRSKSESSSVSTGQSAPSNQKKDVHESSTTDFHKKTQKELEETRMFELLEEKAENSSFCSTSSTVIAFLQQSTPFKMRKTVSGIEHSSINIKQQTSPIIKSSIIQHRFNKIKTTQNGCVSASEPVRAKHPQHLETCNETAECSERLDSSNVNSAQNPQQQLYNKHDLHTAMKNDEADVSLHVRFAEYNEYKTIGLTDTSTISNESSNVHGFADDKSWDDTLTSNGFDTDTSFTVEQQSQLPVVMRQDLLKDIRTTLREQCSISTGTNNVNTRKILDYGDDDDFESLYHNDEDLESTDATNQTSDEEQGNDKYKKDKSAAMIKNPHDCGNNAAVQTNNNDNHNLNEPIFKSELLKSRLLELEKEIDIFRKENIALAKQRQKLQEDREKFCKEFTEAKKQLEESKRQAENQLQEEKKKIARERSALENRMRDAQEKAQQSKIERQEMQSLKDELQHLGEELCLKESRWNAAQSRHKCQVRILKMENAKLKEELEKLKNSKKTSAKTRGKAMKETNTKSMHQINKQLNMQNKENYRNIKESLSNDEDNITSPMMHAMSREEHTKNTESITSNNGRNREQQDAQDANERDIYQVLKRPEQNLENIARRRTLYENLLKEATVDLTGTKETPKNPLEVIQTQNTQANQMRNSNESNCNLENERISPQETNDNTPPRRNSIENLHEQDVNDLEEMHPQNAPFVRIHQQNDGLKTPSLSSEHPHCTNYGKENRSYQDNSMKLDKQNVRQVHHPDGRTEFWYPNGNVKKVFPDQGITKMIYYNGDVRETSQDGKVKYFYASTRTWHTTMPDGLEILEFPDGQVERRLHNGTVEVSFPDGSIRLVQSDGSEKWALKDGTIVETLPNGEKILTLPNGQREVHTKAHKRREYPDGTVKLVYPDGSQETRYSNGRTRLKDKDGNLLMDSYQ